MKFIRFAGVLLLTAASIPCAAYKVGNMNQPTFGTAPAGDVRPTTGSSGSVRPTTPAGNSGNRFTEPMGETHPTTPEGLSAQRFTPEGLSEQRFTPATGPVRPGLDAAAARAEAFSLAPRPSAQTGGKNAAQPQVTAAPAENVSSGSGPKAAVLGGGESGLGGMTASQQNERANVAKNSQAAAALNQARDAKAVEADAMSKIKGLVDSVNAKGSNLEKKVNSQTK